MAGTLTLNLVAQLVHGSLEELFTANGVAITQTTQGLQKGVAVVGSAAEEDLAPGDLTAQGYCVMKNLDADNFVRHGPKTGGGTMEPYGKIKPGEIAVFRLDPAAVVRWRADTADVRVAWIIFDD